uniref:Exosome complex component RRP4 n=1 Tax=Eubosmina coregoni TaxID=186181 RepID=A0A4Y7LNS5_9CRUS|nr:EOG090X09DD [Eubosmina coregoni]SVE69916.1 EOG090X09DD [Eubosmina coregoni]
MMVDIRLQSEVPRDDTVDVVEPKNLVTPGSIITKGTDFMRGHGTYMQDDCLHSSVAGVVERVNSLISVRPLKSRYHGEIGDVVIGRITEVAQKRWKLETNARLDSILLLTSVNLPGGELRRRSAEDELAMRQYLKEGDLVSAEVQNIFGDGALSLHTRSMKYGKLSQGFLLKVNPSLIRRQKNHFHNLPCGASMILGNNGFVWICPTLHEETAGGFVQDLEKVQMTDRLTISRLRNCVAALAQSQIMIFETSILYAYEASLQLGYEVKELLLADKITEIAQLVRSRFESEND